MNELDSAMPSLLTSTLSGYTEKSNNTTGFKVRRIAIFTIIVLCDVIVYFQRSCSTVLADDMAISYGVDPSKIGIFSSLFYYPYSILQPFSGLLADVIEPSYLISGSTLLAAVGAFLCGISKSIFVGYIGRFIVGVGSALVYCPANRIQMNWFPLKDYAKVSGVFLFVAGCGALFAQAPLAILANAIGWRWCFHIIAITAVVLAILTLIFVRGNPVSYGYKPVNDLLADDPSRWTFSQKWHKLVSNFKSVLSFPSFWFIGFFAFFSNGIFYNVSGSWGCTYLMDVFGYSKVKSSYLLLALSIGTNVGSLFLPYVHDLMRSKKLNCIICTIIGIICCLPFIFLSPQIYDQKHQNYFELNNYSNIYNQTNLYHLSLTNGSSKKHSLEVWSILFLFFVLSVTTAALWVSYYPMLTEYYHPESAATAAGWLNGFCFFSSPAFMPFTGMILKHYGFVEGSTTRYKAIGYIYGLWVFSAACLALSLVFIILAKDPKNKGYQAESYVNPDDPNSLINVN